MTTSHSMFSDVVCFHHKMGAPISEGLSHDVLKRRYKLMQEEWLEVVEALADYERYTLSYTRTKSVAITEEHLKRIASELVDLMYTILGTFVEAGIDPQPVWDAVHKANMAKEPHPNGGKAVKPEGWKPARIVLRSFEGVVRAIVGSNRNRALTQSKPAPPARRVVQAIGQPLERSARPRFQVGRASDTLPARKSNAICNRCSNPDKVCNLH